MYDPKVQRQGMTTVYRAQGMIEAQVVKGRLETQGIPVLLDYESVSIVVGATFDGLGEVRVMVPNRYADEANDLLSAEDSGEGTLDGPENDDAQPKDEAP